MIRNWMLMPLLLVAGVVLADEVPGGKPAPVGAEDQAQTEKVQAAAEDAREPAEIQTKSDDAVEAQGEQVAAEDDQEGRPAGPKMVSGMSILGNQEAPKSLVIVPWKSSEIGDGLAISTLLDDSRQPIDRDVFLRALSYYEIMSEKTP